VLYHNTCHYKSGRNQCVFEGSFSKNTVFMLCPGHRMASSMLFPGYFLAKLSVTIIHFLVKKYDTILLGEIKFT
ncbi:MAG: hypothetical protein J7K51_05870, partial [Thermotogae bacterium]|nr:hypothetical protein [Thermotogota bacterium]